MIHLRFVLMFARHETHPVKPGTLGKNLLLDELRGVMLNSPPSLA